MVADARWCNTNHFLSCVCRYVDVFLSEEGRRLVVCMVMEYCDKGDLARLMLAMRRAGGQVEPARAMSWMLQLCEAVSYLHSRGVVHRDLKAANGFCPGSLPA